MSQEPPILEGKPLNAEQKGLVALFDELERKQLDFLDQAGKRLIELSTALLGALFVVTALGDKFPPPYLQGNTLAKALAVATLALHLGVLLAATLALQPRDYPRYRQNLSEMRQVLDDIIRYKARRLKVAGLLFALASLALAALVGSIVCSA